MVLHIQGIELSQTEILEVGNGFLTTPRPFYFRRMTENVMLTPQISRLNSSTYLPKMYSCKQEEDKCFTKDIKMYIEGVELCI